MNQKIREAVKTVAGNKGYFTAIHTLLLNALLTLVGRDDLKLVLPLLELPKGVLNTLFTDAARAVRLSEGEINT